MSGHVDTVRREGAALAAALQRDATAPIGCYAGWDVAELVRHTGQIHRWVTGVVHDRVTERPAGMPEVEQDVERLGAWFVDGVAALVAALDDLGVDDEVWTFARGHDTGGFWHRRMALETSLHRWDAEDAQGIDATVDADLALLGVEEALRVYMEQRLEDVDVGGSGQRIGIRPRHGPGWTVAVAPVGIEVADGIDGDADAVVAGSALDLWLVLTCRRGLDAVAVDGSHDAAALVVGAAAKVGGPAG